MLKPLDGSPLMSENCWRAILNSVNERAKAEKKVRCLEWGAGNSTITKREMVFVNYRGLTTANIIKKRIKSMLDKSKKVT